MWLKEIGRCAHNWLTIVGSIVIMNGGFIRPFNECESLHFDNERDLKIMRQVAKGTIWIDLSSHTICVLHILGELNVKALKGPLTLYGRALVVTNPRWFTCWLELGQALCHASLIASLCTQNLI